MKKLPAETVYYLRTTVWEFNSGLIFTSIWVLFYSVMQLSLFYVSLIYIVITVSNLILEVPTGILADVYSRRLSVIVGPGLCVDGSVFGLHHYPGCQFHQKIERRK